MKLTPEQIDQLYLFTRQHYVEYYDLQTELVDHLANAIEQQWQENTKISFEDALQTEFKKFGIFGFTDLVRQREKFLEEKYDKIAEGYLKEFFKLPLIVLIIVIVMFFTFYIDQKQRYIVIYTLVGVSFLVSVYHWTRRRIKKRDKVNNDSKKWLFEEVLRKHKPIEYFFLYFYLLHIFLNEIKDRIPFSIVFFRSFLESFLIVYLVSYIYIMGILIPSKTKQYLKETYPEYEISK